MRMLGLALIFHPHLSGLLDDAVPHLVGQQHVLLYQKLLNCLVRLGADHVAHCLIKSVHLRRHKAVSQTRLCASTRGLNESRARTDLLRLQVTDDGVDVVEDLINKGHHLSHLDLDEMTPTLLGDLDEGVTCHVLNTVVSFCVGETGNKKTKKFMTSTNCDSCICKSNASSVNTHSNKDIMSKI